MIFETFHDYLYKSFASSFGHESHD